MRGAGGLHARDGGVRCVRPEDLELEQGETAVGDGAVRYRDVLEGSGALVPPDESPVHVPWARHHALLASDFGPPEAAEPIYLRAPDAERNDCGCASPMTSRSAA